MGDRDGRVDLVSSLNIALWTELQIMEQTNKCPTILKCASHPIVDVL